MIISTPSTPPPLSNPGAAVPPGMSDEFKKARRLIVAEVTRRLGASGTNATAETRAEAERKRREQELKEERERREFLFGQARDWRAAQDIRAFVGNVLLESGGADGADDSQLASWSAWAFAEADALDPLKRGLQPWRKADDHEAEDEEEDDDEY